MGMRIIRVFLALVLALMMVLGLSTVVYGEDEAVSVESTLKTEPNSPEIANICSQANAEVGSLTTDSILSYTTTDGVGLLKFSNKNYSDLDSDEKEKFMETALIATTKTSLNAKTKNKIYNFIASQDTPVSNAMKYLQSDANADFLEAKKWIDPFTGVIGTFLGVLCVAIFLFTGVSMVVDLCYLALPGFQAILEGGDENRKPFGVSKEAYYSLRDSEKNNEYSNVVATYLKRRVGLLLLISVCVGYLISGKIYDIVSFFIDSFSSI